MDDYVARRRISPGPEPSALYDRFITDAGAFRDPKTPATLATNASISGRIIWIEGMPLNSWAVWKRFLGEYQHACRSRSLLDRGIFCTPLIGELALDPPVEDACLANHAWRGVVDYLDILTYAASVIHRRASSSVQHRLMVAVVSNLAQWDPRVCDHFADETLERILDPGPSLSELALQRSWQRTQKTDGLINYWHLGMIDNIDRKSVVHSAALAHNDPTSEIARRIWGAEIGVLLPFIEEKRRGKLLGDTEKSPEGSLPKPLRGNYGRSRPRDWSHRSPNQASCRLAIDPEVRAPLLHECVKFEITYHTWSLSLPVCCKIAASASVFLNEKSRIALPEGGRAFEKCCLSKKGSDKSTCHSSDRPGIRDPPTATSRSLGSVFGNDRPRATSRTGLQLTPGTRRSPA